ncbi:helix-turn-helix domain-containing protein [Streptomyces decoyicus]|uniref:helix-turn-helix domain-containing protein n=1 Tax=Streptomyces decoyicus TaxID=249567 RepID=UPI00386D8AEF|nr:RICIN domain-containing protein [Streptomyces decoyicus]
MDDDSLHPADLRNAEEFMAALRALKARSGLTLRQLESRAADRGDVLPRSTVADILRKQTLPRPDLVAALVRACGEQDRLAEWTRAWKRLACEAPVADTGPADAGPTDAAPADAALTDANTDANTDGDDNGHGSGSGSGSGNGAPSHGRQTSPPVAGSALAPQAGQAAESGLRKRPLVLVAAAVLVGAAVTGLLLAGDLTTSQSRATHATDAARARPPEILPVRSAGSWARIRPARPAGLCLTAGRERSGRYRSEVAVQRPCTEPGPRTFLQPAAGDLTAIKWEHPVDKGMGCLTILDSGPAQGLVEPQENCQTDKDAQLFRIERYSPTARGYRLRRAQTDLCLGIRDGATAAGAEAVQEPCGAKPAQRFLIDLIPQTNGLD